MSALSLPTGWVLAQGLGGRGPLRPPVGPQGQGHVTDKWGNRGGLASGEWRREWPGGESECAGRPPPRVLPMRGC